MNTPTKAPNEQARKYAEQIAEGVFDGLTKGEMDNLTSILQQMIEDCTPPQTNGQAGDGELREALEKIYWQATNGTVNAEVYADIANQALATRAPAAGVQVQGRKKNGQYDTAGRMCICGHTAGVHAAEPPHDCFNEDKGCEGATGEPCDCKKFRAVKSTSVQPSKEDEACAREVSACYRTIGQDKNEEQCTAEAAKLIAKRCQQYAEQHGAKREAELVAALQRISDGKFPDAESMMEANHGWNAYASLQDIANEALSAAKARGGNNG